VRGDSRRDLYAKTLALVGLGVLAGAGAVVDYWPVGIRFPGLPSVSAGSVEVPVPLSLPTTDAVELAAAGTSTRAPLVVIEPVETYAEAHGEVPATFAPLPASQSLTFMGDAVELSDLPAPALVVASSELTPEMFGEGARLPAPAVAVAAAPEAYRAEAAERGGFISGAFRRTGSSIARTGAVTGGSVVDAVRIVGGAVRRVIPH
jgi:hypothetical protein